LKVFRLAERNGEGISTLTYNLQERSSCISPLPTPIRYRHRNGIIFRLIVIVFKGFIYFTFTRRFTQNYKNMQTKKTSRTFKKSVDVDDLI